MNELIFYLPHNGLEGEIVMGPAQITKVWSTKFWPNICDMFIT